MQAENVHDPREWVALARRAEDSGYSSFLIPDHLGRLSTFPALMAAAAATSHITLSPYVLNQDFRPPGVLAQEAASVHLLTDGRLELGIGAGWAKHEYAQAGLQYDSAGVRVARFEEYVQVLKGLLSATEPFSFEGRFFHLQDYAPLPKHARPVPILAAGGSPRILAIAGRLADIISVSTPATGWSRRHAQAQPRGSRQQSALHPGSGRRPVRPDRIEHDDARRPPDRRPPAPPLASFSPNGRASRTAWRTWTSSPRTTCSTRRTSRIGTAQQIVEQLEEARERWGFTYLEVSSSDADAIAAVMPSLSGR